MKLKKIIGILLSFVIVCCFGFEIYVKDCYTALDESIQILTEEKDGIEIIKNENHIAFVPENPIAGFIFYPGGKVEFEAYTMLMNELAKQDIMCILMEMPFNLAVFDINIADEVLLEYQADNWYIGGHSLGGSMAASYISNHLTTFDGLVLLASYSTIDLSNTHLNILSIYGSEDTVLSKDKYIENLPFLQARFSEIIIDGGNHSGFGDYGHQNGDGNASITNEEQIQITSEEITKMIRGSVH